MTKFFSSGLFKDLGTVDKNCGQNRRNPYLFWRKDAPNDTIYSFPAEPFCVNSGHFYGAVTQKAKYTVTGLLMCAARKARHVGCFLRAVNVV